MKTGTITCLVSFVLLLTSCTIKGDRKYGAKGISIDSVGIVHNHIVEEYAKQFGLDSTADVTECQLDSIFHRCERITLADSFFDNNHAEKNYVDNFLSLMDCLTKSCDESNCSTPRDWAGACEGLIKDKGLRAAIHDIHYSKLTGPAMISYAEHRFNALTYSQAEYKVRAESYLNIMRHSYWYWQDHLPPGRKQQSTEVAKASADAFLSVWLCPTWNRNFTLDSRDQYILKTRIHCVPIAAAVSIVAAYRR